MALMARTLNALSHIAMDVASRRITVSSWDGADTAIPMGSLMKPFVAIAHGPPYPKLFCRSCWKLDGHGWLEFPEAVAVSCNSYFLELASGVSANAMALVAKTYGLPAPAEQTPEAWIGLGDRWAVSPVGLLRAYCEIAVRREKLLLEGMRRSAQRGTARAIGLNAYAKTGTGPCTHKPKASGDGYAAVLIPAESPRRALLVALHNQPGSEAARAAGDLIRSWRPAASTASSSRFALHP